MKMKFCAVSLSLPPLESGESMGAFKRTIISEEKRVFKAMVPSYCRLRVQKKGGGGGGVMGGVFYTSYCQKHV